MGILDIILLLIGFVALIKGADFFVEGASSLARIMRIPSVVIGLTIVAMGTSAPEASVSITASLSGNNDIAISNIIGSNIFNSLGVVGVCALLSVFYANTDILKRDLPVNLGITALLVIFLLDLKLGRIEGIILLVIMVVYISVMVYSALKNRTESQDEIKVLSWPLSLLYIVGGLAVVIIGGNLVVDHASNIASALGLSQNFIGLTIVAVGTSLPELVTSITATRKNEPGLALGNAVGSNIFNIMFILGASSVLSPISILGESLIDAILLLIVSAILLIFAYTGKKFDKKEGVVCVGLYVIYTIYLLLR